jgi:hypothetical protein
MNFSRDVANVVSWGAPVPAYPVARCLCVPHPCAPGLAIAGPGHFLGGA